MDILYEITARKRADLERLKQACTERDIHRAVELLIDRAAHVPSMRRALEQSHGGIIAEFKRRSPSKGWIKRGADAALIPLDYQKNGAAALSILADQPYFGGSDADIEAARSSGVTLPILYKNFVIDEYQLFQARLCGASAVLLIAACLNKDECRRLLRMAHELGMEVLLEMHSRAETEYADLCPDLCGINNRNLGSFHTDVQTSFCLAQYLPADACRVSESGLKDADTLNALRLAGYRGFLIGERFMKEESPGEALKNMEAPPPAACGGEGEGLSGDALPLLVKVCGMRSPDNIRTIAQLPIDMMGFIFYPRSSRYVGMTTSHTGLLPDCADEALCKAIGGDARHIRKVGVFVDATVQDIVTRIATFHLDAVQLHGTEPPTLIRNLRATAVPDICPQLTVMKAVSIESAADIEQCSQYEGVVDMFVFDTKCHCHGGSGTQFDWSLLDSYHGHTPFLLSGGIGEDDARRIAGIRHPMFAGVDINSRFETAPAIKDADSIGSFIAQLRHAR